ncbi:MAG: PAS domain S-box protein, partial [Comamonadaceae bacterium]
NSPSRALRERAEAIDEKSAAKSDENIESLSSESAREMLHELRVHQIELELQNEELRRRQAELEVLQDRYFSLYEFAPVGYCSMSAKGLILKANLAATTMLGVARVKLVGERISRFIRREDQDVFYKNRKLLLDSGEPQTFELRMVRHDSTPFWAHLEANQIPSADGSPELHFVLIDITERKAAEARLVIANTELVFQNEEKGKRAADLVIAYEELARRTEALRQSDQSLREAQMIGGVGSFDIDVLKDRWTGTDQLEAIYGIDANYARDFKAWTRLVHPDDRRALIAYCLDFSDAKSDFDRVFRIIRANDGAVRWIHGVGKVLCDASGKAQRIVGTAQDITARREAEDEVRKL